MMNRDMLKKATKLNFLRSTCPSASFALQFGDFVPHGRSAANGPSCRSITALSSIKRHLKQVTPE